MGDAARQTVTLRFDAPQVLQAIEHAPQRLEAAARRQLLRYMRRFVSPAGHWQRLQMRGRPGLFRRTGDLARSFAALDVSTGGLGGVAVLGFTTSRYARVHEFGAVIRARNKPFLMWRAERAGQGVSKGQWVRAKEVTIPARMGFRTAFASDDVGRGQALQKAALQALGIREVADDGGA